MLFPFRLFKSPAAAVQHNAHGPRNPKHGRALKAGIAGTSKYKNGNRGFRFFATCLRFFDPRATAIPTKGFP